MKQELNTLICERCGQQAEQDDCEFREFISVKHIGGYGSIHGDGNQIAIDICQRCFSDMCGDSLTVSEPFDQHATDSPDDVLQYHNIFSAISQSKKVADSVKQSSDFLIAIRDILSASKITTTQELQVALKRIEQLWDAQYHSVEGNELHTLADLICAYEKRDWNSFFEQVPLADDDFMSERGNFSTKSDFEETGAAKGTLKNITVNKGVDVDGSRQSAIDEGNLVSTEDESNDIPTIDVENLLELHQEMINIFCDQTAVQVWIHTPLPLIGDQKPISLLSSAKGQAHLRKILNKMKYGEW